MGGEFGVLHAETALEFILVEDIHGVHVGFAVVAAYDAFGSEMDLWEGVGGTHTEGLDG